MSPFTLYPAIDVLGGACVRLFQGDYAQKTAYGDNPAHVATRWLSAGARWLHVVDLDAAKSGTSVNHDAIAAIVEQAQSVGASVQVGGGIRTHDAIAGWLNAGVTRCVIGTAARDVAWMAEAVSRFGSEALVVGLDGRGGRLAVNGWLEQTDVALVDIARQLADVGVRHALVTDVDRDGAMVGANLALASEIVSASGLQAIASGGVRNLADVLEAKRAGLAGAIAGRSLYDGTLDVSAALAAIAEVDKC